MSLKHLRQAQAIAKEADLDSISRAVLYDIATDIGHDGRPSFPSFDTISERTGYHKNTVAGRVKSLKEAGLLIVTKRGRGNQYTLPECDDVSIDEADCHMDYHTNSCDDCEPKSHIDTSLDVSVNERLTHLENQLTHLIGLLTHQTTELTHLPPSIDTSRNVPKDHKYLEEEVYIYTHAPTHEQTNPSFSEFETIQNGKTLHLSFAGHPENEPEPIPEPVQEMMSALAGISKTALAPGINEKVYQDAAYMLIGYDATPVDVKNTFADWWFKGGGCFYKQPGPPALKTIVDNWKTAVYWAENGKQKAEPEPIKERYVAVGGQY